MIVVKPDIKTVLGQIWRVAGHQSRVVMFGFSEQNPSGVRPPASIVGRVRIAFFIGFLVMNAMRRDPENRSTFQRERSANREKILQQPWHSVRTVRMQAMVAHADAQANRHPIKKCGNKQRLPGEEKERGNRSHMEQPHHNSRGPVETFAVEDSLRLSNLGYLHYVLKRINLWRFGM